MKKIILASLYSILMPLSIYAQVSIGLRAGFNASDMHFSSATDPKSSLVASKDQLKGIHADFLLNIPLYERLHIQPVFRYITKGTHLAPTVYQSTATDGEWGNRVLVHYLEIPVNVLYKIPVGSSKLALGGGPYVAYGLGGTYRSDLKMNGNVVTRMSRSMKFDEGDDVGASGTYLSRWDAGLNFTAGIELNNIVMIGANYSAGLINIDNSAMYKVRNSYIGVSIGILFNREDY
jgi:hypothetical protein